MCPPASAWRSTRRPRRGRLRPGDETGIAGHLRTHRGVLPVGADHAAAGAGGAAAGHLRGAGHAARGRAADQRHHGQRADSLPRGLGAGRRADGDDTGRAGAVADRRRRACDVGVAARPGGDHRAVQGGRAAHRGAGAAVRHGELERRLAAARTRRARPDHQAQGHRRRADRHADAVQPRARTPAPSTSSAWRTASRPTSSACPARAR